MVAGVLESARNRGMAGFFGQSAGPAAKGEEPAAKADPAPDAGGIAPGPDGKVRKTDLEWQKLLTAQQFAVLRMKATEQPWSGKYAKGHFKGTFVCAGCGAELFS